MEGDSTDYINVIFLIFYNMIDKPLNLWCIWTTPDMIIRALFDNFKQEFHQVEWFNLVKINHDLLRVSSHVGCISIFWVKCVPQKYSFECVKTSF